jgi:hypothetical protein
MRYTVVLLREPEEGGYTALVPALPGCVSFGDSLEEALAMIQTPPKGTSRSPRNGARSCWRRRRARS